MKIQPLLSLGMMAAGAAAAIGPVRRRAAWDRAHSTVRVALDYDDLAEVAGRANQPLDNLLHALWHAGATHLTVPEDTLARLMAQGRIGTALPRQPLAPPASGRWSYLAASALGLLERVQAELAARQPGSSAHLIDDDGQALLAVAGDLQALLPIGLGFDPDVAHSAFHSGLEALPRPTSYPWPTAATIDRTLSQAAALARSEQGSARMVAFQGIGTLGHPGELILGHEMLIQDTIASLKRHGLAFAYFVESRHQRGDWFVAKSLAPNVVLAHQFSQAEMVPEDMHTAAHRWGLLAREKGIRLALLNCFKVVHATAPLDCIDYVAAVADVLVNREGLRLAGRPEFRPAAVHHHHDHGHNHSHHHPGDHGAEGDIDQPHHHDPGQDGSPDRDLGVQHRDRDCTDEAADPSQGATSRSHDEIGHDHDHPHTHESTTNVEAPQGAARAGDHSLAGPPNSGYSFPSLDRDDRVLPLIALIPAGAGALALSELLDLPDAVAVPLTLAGLAAPLVVRLLDRPANALEAAFRPSYAPKLIALGTTALAPLASSLVGYRGGLPGLLEAVAVQGLAAIGLAAAVADHDYALRIEAVKYTHLGWIVPLAGALAVTLAPAGNSIATRRQREVPARIEIVTVPEAKTSPAARLAEPAGLAIGSLKDQSKIWAQRSAMTLAEAALTRAIDQGSVLLQRRLPGIAGPAAVWAFRQGGSYAQRRLLAAVAAAWLAPALPAPTAAVSGRSGDQPALAPATQTALAAVKEERPAVREIRLRAWRLGVMAAVVGAGLVATKAGVFSADPLASLDVEHTSEHTHHLSRAQAAIGDASMALSLQPLRKWTLPTLAAQTVAAFAPGPAAGLSTVAAALGEAAFLAGFRQAARPVRRTVLDRLSFAKRS